MNKDTNKGVFMCLDVNSYSFSSSTYGNTKGVVILTIFTIVYWFIAFSFLELFMLVLDTLSKTKPLVTYIFIYCLITQKIVRVFIIHEKERLAEFMEQSRRNIVTLGEFYDVRSSGYERQTRVHPKTGREQEFHKVRYKDGVEEHIVKFSRGSITSEFADTENSQIKLTCNFINSLMVQGIIPRIVISDERIERSTVFKFYQHQLRQRHFTEEFTELCNDTLMYHESTAEMYSRITANYYFIPSRTAKQKIFMDNFVKTVGANLNFSTFREISLLNKTQILTMFKDLNGLNAINEHELQTEEAKRRVPLGNTHSLYVRDIITNEVKELGEDSSTLRLSIKNIDYKVLRKTGEMEKREEIVRSSTDIDENKAYDDLFDNVDLPDLEDVRGEVTLIEESLSLPESPNRPIDVYSKAELTLEATYYVNNGVFDFTAIPSDKSTIEKSIMLLNTLQSDECEVIII